MDVGSIVRGNLRIVRLLGAGAMGAVYLAENTNLPDIHYALKVLHQKWTHDEGFRQRFYVEAKNQCTLDHPNIVQVLDFFQEDDEYCLLLSYVEGQALSDLIEQKGRIPEKQALGIFSGILQGLDCAHRAGIIHRDVKPSNVMIGRDGRARLTDFGIAIRMGDLRLTKGAGGAGTPLYMSPEQVTNPHGIDQRSDVYSAGVVLFEMLTGKVPFDGQTDFAIAEQIVNAPRPNPREFNRDIPEALSRIILRALEQDPNRRFPGCGAFLKAIRAYRWPAPKKTLVAGLALASIVAAGGWLYNYLNPEVEVVTEEVPNPEPVVKAATQALAVLCRDSAQITAKERGEKTAKGMGETLMAEQFARQVTELRANIHDFTTLYANQLAQLATTDHSLVDSALQQPADSAARERYRQWLIADFAQKSKEGRTPNEAELVARCSTAPAESVADTSAPGQRIGSEGGQR